MLLQVKCLHDLVLHFWSITNTHHTSYIFSLDYRQRVNAFLGVVFFGMKQKMICNGVILDFYLPELYGHNKLLIITECFSYSLVKYINNKLIIFVEIIQMILSHAYLLKTLTNTLPLQNFKELHYLTMTSQRITPRKIYTHVM